MREALRSRAGMIYVPLVQLKKSAKKTGRDYYVLGESKAFLRLFKTAKKEDL